MENMERQKFDDAWQDALKDAEQSPSEHVWNAVDSKLTVAEGGTMKRRVIFYQRLAAASILFAVVFGSLTAYYVNEDNKSKVELLSQGNLNHERPKDQVGEIQSTDEHLEKNLLSKNDKDDQIVSDQLLSERAVENEITSDQLNNTKLANDNNVTHNFAGSEQTDLTKKENISRVTIQKQSVFLVDSKERIGDGSNITSNKVRSRNQNFANLSSKDIPSPEADISGNVKVVVIKRMLPAMPSSMMADSRKEKMQEKETVWASIGASAGNYSPQGNFNQPAPVLAASGFSNLVSNQSVANNSPSKGTAYSVGINVAKKVSERWVVLGGINYLNQEAGYTSNLASISSNNTPSVYSADYASKQNISSALALTSPYEINSVNEFVSVPLQAGYLILNRKVGLQINSGVATDIFLQNTLTDKSGQLNKYTESAGSDSPYKSLSWSAIMGSELSYKIGSQYRVSLVPGLRYSMSPVLKSNSTTSNPMVWDLGFRFRYIFK